MPANITMNDGGGPTVGSIITTLGATVSLSNFDDSGILGHQWIMKDRPIGSSAALSSVNNPTTDFVPDVEGTYLIELRTYTDAARTTLEGGDVQGAGVLQPGPFDWRIPAAGETTQFNSDRGWAQAREESIRDVHTFMNSGLPQLTGVVNAEVLGGAVEEVFGGFVLDAREFPSTALKLRIFGRLTLPSFIGDGTLRLYDMGEVGSPPAGGILRASVAIPALLAGGVTVQDTALTPVAAPAAPGEIILARHRYELRAELVGGSPGDVLKIHNGGITMEA